MNIYKGVTGVITIMQVLGDFMHAYGDFDADGRGLAGAADDGSPGSPRLADSRAIKALLADAALGPLWQERMNGKLPYARVADYDGILRFRHRETILQLLRYIYHLDVYLSVAKVAVDRRFAFADAAIAHAVVADAVVTAPAVPDPTCRR